MRMIEASVVNEENMPEVQHLGQVPRKRKLTESRRQQNKEAQKRYREKRKILRAINHGKEEDQRSAHTASTHVSKAPLTPDTDSTLEGLDIQTSDESKYSSAGDSSSDCRPGDLPDRTVMGERRQRTSLLWPSITTFQLEGLNFSTACIHNAQHIGLPSFLASLDDATSPWYWDHLFDAVLSTNVAIGDLKPNIPRPIPPNRCFAIKKDCEVSKDLVPSELQRTRPHQLYIDMIPFPVLRNRMINLLAMEPPMIDEEELKYDMKEDGLMIWGPFCSDEPATQDCTMFMQDSRNWECSKPFYEKWKLLLNGSGLDEQSKWWWRTRGEI